MTRRWVSTLARSGFVAAVTIVAAMVVDGPSRGAVFAAGALGICAVVVVQALRSGQPERSESEERKPDGYLGYPCACADPGRRSLLRKGVVGGGILVGALSVIPLWPATQRAERALRRTSWRPGTRLVDDRDRPLRIGDLEEGSFTTVWPEGHGGDGDSQAVLIRLAADRRVTAPGRDDWLAEGHVAYSKLCTHMGCPVGLYQSRGDLLVCPCHQATFDVLRGAEPVHGPAERPLPQLPLAVDGRGYLIATGDFPTPVGPSYWGRPS